MSREERQDFLAMIERKMAGLERCPKTWGSDETQQMIMLNLIEIRASLLRPMALKKDPLEVRRAWQYFVSSINGEPSNLPLHIILKKEGKSELLPTLLGDFGRWVLQEHPPEEQYNG